MPVRFFYVDESHDDKKFCLSAISIRHTEWRQCFDEVRAHRVRLNREHGFFLSREIHARDLVSGHGRISPTPIGKWQRSRIFFGLLQLVARLPEVLLFNVCLDKSGRSDAQLVAWDRLLNRIERTMLEMERRESVERQRLMVLIRSRLPSREVAEVERRLLRYKARAFIIADEGREVEITRAIRKMHVHNPIPSQFGAWSDGRFTRSICVERVIEDPAFKSSMRSYFLQLADCVAFALLKREVTPTARIKKYKINEMFDQALSGVCFKHASPRDQLGIVRS